MKGGLRDQDCFPPDCSYCHGNHERADCPNLPTWRDQVIEECARALDEAAIEADNDGWTACDYAAYLRSLKDKP